MKLTQGNEPMTYEEAINERNFQGAGFIAVKTTDWNEVEKFMVVSGDAELANYLRLMKDWDVKIEVIN